MPVQVDLAAAFEASPNPYMILDRELRYVAANGAYRAVTGRTREELLGKHVLELFPHDPANPDNDNSRRLVESFRRVLDTGKPDILALIHYRIPLDGREVDRWWSATHTPLLDQRGEVAFILQHTTDVTELEQLRRTSEAAGMLSRTRVVEERNATLTGQLAMLQRAVQGAPGFMCFLRGPELVYEFANDAYRALVGAHRPLVGLPLHQALSELAPHYAPLLQEVRRTRQPYIGRAERFEVRSATDGASREVFADLVFQPIVDDRGQVEGVFVLGSDITESVRARREVDAARAELQAIFDAFPEALLVAGPDGISRANDRARALLGYGSVDDLRRPAAAIAVDTRPRDPATGEPIPADEYASMRALRGLETRREVLLRRVDTGEELYTLAAGAPVLVDGTPVAAVTTLIDLTEQKRREVEVAQLARVLDAAHDFVGIADLDGRPTFVNAAGLAMVGIPDLEAVRRMHMLAVVAEDDHERMRTTIIPAAMRDGHWVGELTFRHTVTGEHIPVLYSIFPLRDRDRSITALATITRDLRGEKRIEAERHRLLEAERAARAEAEEASRLKDQFVATVSHELRTPLTSILGWLQMLRAGLVAPDRQARALETVERNARVQAQLIDDLLDVSRIVSGKLALELTSVEIAVVVAAAVETVRPVAEQKGVELVSRVDAALPLLADARRLQQVVWNLLSNAVKFTPRGGRVEVIVDRDEDKVVITVADNGIGLDPAFLPHVFDRFRQADGGESRRQGGLGLGLSIVEHVVKAHGGEVRASSAGLGRGSTFVVRLQGALAAPSLRRDEASPALEPPAELRGRRVLVVEDEDDTREYLAALLREARMSVRLAPSAEAALALVEQEPPDVVLSDLAMPGTDGYRLVRSLRALSDERGGRTPAIALTAFAGAEDRMRALRAGFQNHVAKPVHAAELFAVLAAVLPPP